MANGDTPQILQGIMDAIPRAEQTAPNVQVPMRPSDQAPDVGFEQTPVEQKGGTLPLDPIHIMATAFMGQAAENQKQYEAEAAGKSPDAAPGSFRSKLAGALSAAGAGLGDAAAAQGGPNDRYSGWLGAVGRVLNARTARKAEEQKTAFDQSERLKNDQINLAVANANLRQHALTVHKMEKEDRDQDAAAGELFMSHLRAGSELSKGQKDNFTVTDNISNDELKQMMQKDPNFAQTHTARITGYEKVLNADGSTKKDANGFDVETPLYSIADIVAGDKSKTITVTPELAKKWNEGGVKQVTPGTILPATVANQMDVQAQRYGTTLSILNHDKTMPLPNEVKDQMVTALNDPNVQHAVAMSPGSPLAGLYAAADNMQQHIALAQKQLDAAQKAGDQNAVQKLTQDIQSHQDIAQKLDKTIDMGFTPQERAEYAKQKVAQEKEDQKEQQDQTRDAETARHNREMEAIDRLKATTATPEDIAHAGQMLADSMEDPSQLSARAGGKQGKQALINAADDYSYKTYGKPYNPAQQQTDYKYASKAQDTLKYLNSLTGGPGVTNGGNLGELVKQSNGITRTEFPPLNDAAAWARLKTGDPKIAAYQTVVTEVADQVAKILQGGGTGNGTSDAKLKQAQEMFDKSFTKDQITAIANELNPLLGNRSKAIIGNNRYLQNQFYGPSGITVTMVKDGHAVEVPQKNVDEAIKRGGHIQTREEYQKSLRTAPQQ